MKSGQEIYFSSEKIFLTQRIPKGEYILKVGLVDTRTSKDVASTEVTATMQKAEEQTLKAL